MTGTQPGPTPAGPRSPKPTTSPSPWHPARNSSWGKGCLHCRGKSGGFYKEKKKHKGPSDSEGFSLPSALVKSAVLGEALTDMQSKAPLVPTAQCACASPTAMARVQPGWAHGHPYASEIPTPASVEHQGSSHRTWGIPCQQSSHGS